MAKYNSVTLYGSVIKTPTISEDRSKATFLIAVVRADRETGSRDELRLECPIVIAKGEDFVNEISSWQENDFVLVQGVIVHKWVQKAVYCPDCGHEEIKSGELFYVEPTYLERIFTDLDKKASRDMLTQKNRSEISNKVILIGNLVDVPVIKTNLKNERICTYKIATPRTYRLLTDQSEEDTDYFYITSFGKHAERDQLHLSNNTTVLVTGYMQARKSMQNAICSECGASFDYVDSSVGVVSYETEYLRNYIGNEELGITTILKNNKKEQSNVDADK